MAAPTPDCPQCHRPMVKAETETRRLVAGAYARLLGLTGGGAMEQTIYFITAGGFYCPTCSNPAPPPTPR